MRLRARIALTTTAILLPLAIVFVFLEARVRERLEGDVLVERARVMLDEPARAACEASPDAWARSLRERGAPPLGPPPSSPPPIHLFPFDTELHARADASPIIDQELVAAIRGGAPDAWRRVRDGQGANDQALLRTPWGTGPCAYVLAVRPSPPSAPQLAQTARSFGVLWLALVAAIALATAPIVARIRRLGASVRASARHRYEQRVELSGNDEIAELASSFDAAAREVRTHVEAQEHRERTLREYLATTTHDVMTPVTVLQGHLASLRAAAHEGATVDAATIDAAVDEVSYLAALVHNLGVAARIEAGEPHVVRVPVDVGRVVERCVARHRPIAVQRGVEIERAIPEGDVVIDGDETLLERAVSNLVFNAIRHNRAGGHVAVVLSEQGERDFRVRVVDDGPGMTDEELAIANDPRSPDGARTRTLSGLGLSITRRIADLHALRLVFARSEAGGVQADLEGKARAPADPA